MSITNQIVKPPEDPDLEDPLEKMLKKTGCLELHYQVQECITSTQDWRQCQTYLQEFKQCMDRRNQQQLGTPP